MDIERGGILEKDDIIDPVDNTTEEKTKGPRRKFRAKRSSEFGWESFGSIESSRKNELIAEIYDLAGNNEDRIAAIKEEWSTLVNDGETAIEERFQKALEHHSTRGERIQEAVDAKRAILEEAKTLELSTEWRKSADRLKQLQKNWRDAGFAGEDNDQLWETFSAINDTFFNRRHEHYVAQESQRKDAKELKNALIEESKQLSTSEEWRETSKRFKEMLEEWKKVGSAGRDIDDTLWEAFNTPRQVFYQAQNAYFDLMNVEQANAKDVKQALVDEAEKLNDALYPDKVVDRMDAMMEDWKAAGFSGRAHDQKLWDAFNEIRTEFYTKLKNKQQQNRKDRKEELDDEIEAIEIRIRRLSDLQQTLENKIEAVKSKPLPSEDNENFQTISAALAEEVAELERLSKDNQEKLEESRELHERLHNEWADLA